MEISEVCAYVAYFFLFIGWVPQILKLYKTKSSEGVALGTPFILLLAAILLTIYGFLKQLDEIAYTNSVVGLTVVYVICLIIYYRKK